MRGGLIFILLMTFASFGHGALIGYLRIPEVVEPEPEFPQEARSNAFQRFYHDGLLPIFLYPVTQGRAMKSNNFEDFGGYGGFGLKFWRPRA